MAVLMSSPRTSLSAGPAGLSVDITLHQVEYFPHNDTLNTLYRCNGDTEDQGFRSRTCTFSTNVSMDNF